MKPLLAEMIQDGQLELKSFFFGKDQLGKYIIEYRPLAKVTPVLRWFSDVTYHMLTSLSPIIGVLPGAKLAMIRTGIAWSSRNDLDPMPYESALFSDEQPKDSQLNRLATIGREFGWKSL